MNKQIINWITFTLEVSIILATGKLIVWVAELTRKNCLALNQLFCDATFLILLGVYGLAVIAFIFHKLNYKHWLEE